MRCGNLGLLLAVAVASAGIAIFCITPKVGQGKASPLFDKIPLNTEFTFSNGESIQMPFQVWEGQHIMLVGTAAAELATPFLKDLGLFPLEASDGRPLAVIGAVRYEDCVAGSYNEFYLSFVASKSPPSGSAIMRYVAFALATNEYLSPLGDMLGMEQVSFVVWKMLVTTNLSLLAGREIWGYPKDIAPITILTDEDGFGSITSAEVFDENEVAIASLSFKEPERFSWPWWTTLPISVVGSTVTPRRFMHSHGNSRGDFLARMAPFDETKGHGFSLTPACSAVFGDEVLGLDFRPWLWFDMPIFEAVLEAPYYTE